jgi:biopolymer transport protein ExbD
MKSLIAVCLIGTFLICMAGAQEASTPALQQGVSVQMPVADHGVEMPAADEQQATVIAITADGKLFAGVQPIEAGALGTLNAETVYVKADSRVPFQKVLTVLDALRGKSVVLLAASPANLTGRKVVPPFGIRLTVSR